MILYFVCKSRIKKKKNDFIDVDVVLGKNLKNND